MLLLTGEAPNVATIDYLAEAVAIANEYFSSVSIEMYAMDLDQYTRLCEAGLEGVTLYMETYDRDTYTRMHQAGVKQDYEHRLNALERAGRAGAWKLNLGVLLGLFDWHVDAFWMALHARYLQKQCWQSAVSISFPRLRHAPARFEIPAPVGDTDLVHMMLAMRLLLPEAGMVVSTRESAEFRDPPHPARHHVHERRFIDAPGRLRHLRRRNARAVRDRRHASPRRGRPRHRRRGLRPGLEGLRPRLSHVDRALL